MKQMTAVLVLRTVPVSDDGITTRDIVKGTVDHVLSELFDGLKAEGYVTEAEPPFPADGEPLIPADWRDLHFMKQISLAKQFDPSVTKKDEAIAVLEAAEKAQQA